MKIYIASSWKQEVRCKYLAEFLRKHNHEVDLFCEARKGREIFSFSEIKNYKKIDCIEMLGQQRVQKAFHDDKKWLDWADLCLLVLPSGRSAHLEAGYAKGQGKKLFIVGEFPKGEFDVMYGFADKIFKFSDFIDYVNFGMEA
jgi:hypothetical protein